MNIRNRFRILMAPNDGAGTGGVAAPAAPAPAAPPAPPIAWLPEADTDTVGFIQNKAWQTPADSVKAYRELERFVGADKAGRGLVLPTEDTPQAWGPVFDKLGRPANPEGYKLPVPEGQPGDFAQTAAQKFHEMGLSQKQGQALANWWNEQGAAAEKAQAEAEAAKLESEKAELAKLWGNEVPLRTELARRAAQQYGIDGETLGNMMVAAGYSKTLQLFAKLGDTLREHGAEGLGELGSFGMTPQGAAARRKEMMADPNIRTRAMNPNSAEWNELRKLDRIIAGMP